MDDNELGKDIQQIKEILTRIETKISAPQQQGRHTKKRKLQHRPLTIKELEAKAASLNRRGQPHPVQIDLEVASSLVPEPKATTRRAGDLWRVQVNIPGATTVRRTGLTAEALFRPTRPERIPRQLDGFIPNEVPVRILPLTEQVAAQQVRLRGPKGNYTPLIVFPGNDARKLLTDNSWPWNLTGLVTTSDGKAGSGVLVGDRLMLTAHHLRPSNSIARGSWWMTFTPNFDGGNIPNAPFGASYVSDLRHYDEESDAEYVAGHDYMLCRLFDPLGQQLGYLGATSFDDDWRGMQAWHNVGYPNDVGFGTRPVVQINQSMEDDYEDDDGQIIETEASLDHGNSGGPFFSWFNDGHVRLCGVVSGEFGFDDDRDNALAGGDDMVDLIAWGRSNWPA